jgi:formate dehydrogenase alpha subunit
MKFENVLTTCPYCGCGCGFYLQVINDQIVGVIPCKTHPVNEGRLCIKGWNAHAFIHDERRLTNPLMKKNGKFEEVSWDEAINKIAEKLKEIKDKHGPDSIGVLSSARCTNEENYLLMKLARAVIGTNNVDHCARLCHASTVAGLAYAFGSGAMTNSQPEFEDCDCILITGSNTIEQHPLIGGRILRAIEKGAKLIVVDPRRIPIAKFADKFLQFKPGTDVAWLNGFMNVIINENLHDQEFIDTRTEGFEEFKKILGEYTPEKVQEISGIPAEDLIEAAKMYASADKASIVYSMGITQHTTGVDNVKSTANLAMLTGNMGRPSTGVNPLRGQNNVQGACDLGALPNVYSGYQKVGDEAVQAKFAEAWDCSTLSPDPGLTVVEMMNAAAEGKLKAMFIMGENPMISDPDINHVKEALENLELLVVQDIFPTETSELADIVLPGASFAEKDGTFTATDRRVQRIRKAIDPLGDSKPDWEIICLIGKAMGNGGQFEFGSPKDVADEIAKVTPIYGGITFERLERDVAVHWPCLDADHPGTPFLHKDKFSRGKGLFSAIEFKEPAELPDDEYPLLLTTGRVIFQWHTGTMTRKSPKLEQEAPTGFIELNPADAESLGVENGEMVKISSRRGEIQAQILITDGIKPGIVFMPFHYAECAANVLTNAALDPIAKIPELKVCAVRIEEIS